MPKQVPNKQAQQSSRELVGLRVLGMVAPYVVGRECMNPLANTDIHPSQIAAITKLTGNVYHVERTDGSMIELRNCPTIALYEGPESERPLSAKELQQAARLTSMKMDGKIPEKSQVVLDALTARLVAHEQEHDLQKCVRALRAEVVQEAPPEPGPGDFPPEEFMDEATSGGAEMVQESLNSLG